MSEKMKTIRALEAERNRLIASNERQCPQCGQKFKGGRATFLMMRHYASKHDTLIPWARYAPDPGAFNLPEPAAQALSLKYGRTDLGSLVLALRRLCETTDRPISTEMIKIYCIDRLDDGPGRKGWEHWDGTWDEEQVFPEEVLKARDQNPRLTEISAQVSGLWVELEAEMASYNKMLEPKAIPAVKPAAKPKPRPRVTSAPSPPRKVKPKARKKKTNGSKIPFEELARLTAEENLERLSEVWGSPIPKELAVRFLCIMPVKELRALKFGGTRMFQRTLGSSAERLGLYLHGRPWSKKDGLTLKVLRNEVFPALLEELEALVPRSESA